MHTMALFHLNDVARHRIPHISLIYRHACLVQLTDVALNLADVTIVVAVVVAKLIIDNNHLALRSANNSVGALARAIGVDDFTLIEHHVVVGKPLCGPLIAERIVDKRNSLVVAVGNYSAAASTLEHRIAVALTLEHEPLVTECAVCGNRAPAQPVFDVQQGVLLCRECAGAAAPGMAALDAGSLAAMRHVLRCEQKRLLSFRLNGETMTRFAAVCERFAAVQLERRFRTLEFYQSIKGDGKA